MERERIQIILFNFTPYVILSHNILELKGVWNVTNEGCAAGDISQTTEAQRIDMLFLSLWQSYDLNLIG